MRNSRFPSVCVVAATLVFLSAAGAVLSNPVPARPNSGEPYALAGKRLVFTNWFYIRPGGFAWLDANGNNVTVVGSQEPHEARFQRTDSPQGMRLVAQPAQRVGPITRSEFPWETKGIAITTVIREGDKYRAWSSCSGEKNGGLAYFESADGMTWTRPKLGIVKVDGQDTNLLGGPDGTVFIDPSAPSAERYKMVTLNDMTFADYEAWKKAQPDRWEPRARREDVGHACYIQGAVSPDGLHWTTLPDPLVVEHSDTQIVAYYDTRLHKYVIYTRGWMVGDQSPTSQPGEGRDWYSVGRRSIGRTESEDFRRFPLSNLIMVPPSDWPPSDVLYTNCRTSIPGAPDLHLMFPTVWRQADDATHVVMAASHDGIVWSYVPGGPVAETAPFANWDGGCIFARPNLVEMPDGAFALPYTGYNVPHKYPRGRFRFQTGWLTWPKGRLVALEAPQLGEFATVAIKPPGRRLLINALTQRGGSIRIELAGMNGRPLPGRSLAEADPIIGDLYRHPVTWSQHDDMGFQPDQGVILRFRLDRAKLFALDFE
jgi:hypothetical protein